MCSGGVILFFGTNFFFSSLVAHMTTFSPFCVLIRVAVVSSSSVLSSQSNLSSSSIFLLPCRLSANLSTLAMLVQNLGNTSIKI